MSLIKNKIMHTPTKSQWQTVIDNLEKVLPIAKHENHLDMTQPDVNNNISHECGTTHCLGGWYAIAIFDINRCCVNFSHGANLMAVHLGFSDRFYLANWAKHNPEIWGNECGDYIFCSESAFNGAESLSEIVEYLKGVRDRSPE